VNRCGTERRPTLDETSSKKDVINSAPHLSLSEIVRLSPRPVDSNAMWTTLLRVYRWISCHVASHKLPCPNKVHGTEDLQESETQNASMVPAKVKARPLSQGDLAPES
jgi:hypothetical protein